MNEKSFQVQKLNFQQILFRIVLTEALFRMLTIWIKKISLLKMEKPKKINIISILKRYNIFSDIRSYKKYYEFLLRTTVIKGSLCGTSINFVNLCPNERVICIFTVRKKIYLSRATYSFLHCL